MEESMHATGETELVLDMADTQPAHGAPTMQGDYLSREPRAGTIAEANGPTDGNDLEALLRSLMVRSLPSTAIFAERVVSPTDDQASSGLAGGVSTLEAAISVTSEDVPPTPTAPTVTAATALDSTDSVVSVAGFENPHDMLGEPEPSLAGLAGLAASAPRSAGGSSVDGELYRSGESNTAAPMGPDGGLISLLRRLAFSNVEPAALNESLARSLSRLAQILTTLSGERLTDEQIRALPKVRFEDTREQTCAICLETYNFGDLLTALPCAHFFHVDCVTRWFTRSTQCPLCRSQYGS